MPNLSSRFDKTTRIHAHFLCHVCGEVTDVSIDETQIMREVADKNPNEFLEAEIIFRGYCPKCKNKSGEGEEL